MDNLEFVFSLFNQYLFQDAKNNISALQYYFDTNYSTAGNKLVGELINAIKTYDLASIDLPLLNSVMMKTGKTPDESNKIISEIVKWKQFDRKQIEPARKFLEEVVAGSIIQKANNLFPNQPSEYLKYLKNAEYKTTSNIDTLNAVSFSKIDINSIIAERATTGVESHYSFINQSFKPDCKYEMGQLVIVSAPPGCFTGDTEVFIANGTTKTLKELYESRSKNITVYSCDGDYPRISVADNCILTKETTELVEVCTEDGGKIKSTPDHLYMLIDGSYKMAKDLKVDDILMPFNLQFIDNSETDSIVSSGKYTQVWTRDKITKFMSHRLTGDYLRKKNPSLYFQTDLVAHHNGLDNNGRFNRYDNRVESIVLISSHDHKKIHALKQLDDKELKGAFLDGGKNTRFTSEQISEWNKRNWSDPEYREKMIQKLKSSAKKGRERSEQLMEEKRKMYGMSKLNYNTLCGFKYGKMLIDNGLANSQETLEKIWDSTRYKKDDKGKIVYYLNRRVPLLKSMKYSMGDKFNALFEFCKSYTNHTVTSVNLIKLDKPEPVYDIVNVDLYSNFAIKTSKNTGIFVHNCGKTLFGMTEALHMAASGHKVLFFCMGDNAPKDFIVRMAAQYSGLPFWDAKNNLATIYNAMTQVIGDNLDISIVPAGSTSVDEFIEFVEEKDYEIVFADYDSNFKSDKVDQNMYLGYGEIYEKLTKLTLEGKLVFVMSQPTRNSWGNETIELNEIGESSRKAHNADIILTRGRVVGNPNHLGKFKIVKNRRGEEGIEVGSVRLNNGRFIIVPDGVYSMLKQDTMPKNYTEADIEGMISRYNATMNQVRQKVNQATQSQQRVSGPTPFGRP